MLKIPRNTDLIWGDQQIEPPFGTEHFLVVGASGSGKTTIINRMLRSVFTSGFRFRSMIYDPKQEVLPYLYGLTMSQTGRVKVLHPFDTRSCAWDLAEDLNGPVSARQFATNLITDDEEGPGSESFFTNAVRDLLTGIILSFINCVPNPKSWTFRDLILTMLYEPYLRFILEMNLTRDNDPFPFAARLRESYLTGDTRTTSNIRATINTKLSIYEPVAAVWHLAQEAKQTFALSKWVKEGCRDVLVLGNDESSRAAIDAINQAIFKRATELLLANREAKTSEKNTGENQTWFFLDEVREAGKLDGLSRLLTKGRSKGACIVLGFQDIDGMRNAYGEEIAHEICGQCNNIAVLKLNSPSTAKWATELFGSRLTQTRNSSGGMGRGGVQASAGVGEEERPWVYTSDLLYTPPTSLSAGLRGHFRSPDIDPEKNDLSVHLDWNTDIKPFLPTPHPDVAAKEAINKVSPFCARIPRDVPEHYLKPWNAEDWDRLGFTCPIPAWQTDPSLITAVPPSKAPPPGRKR